MQKKLRITVEGKAYDVLVEDVSASEDTYSALSSAMVAPVAVVSSPENPVPSTPVATPVAAGEGDEISPLSGVVESVDVVVGQAVAAGDKIAVIEAMKMKTPVHAHKTGTVRMIAVKPGDAIVAGGLILSVA